MAEGLYIRRGCRRVTAITAWMALALMSGCGLFNKPFTLNVDAIDDQTASTPARIRLSSPQVFTREQLINDRLNEAGFLGKQLDRTQTEALGNSLSRDIQVITALSAQLSLSFDPSQRSSFRNQTQQADLQQQIDTVELQSKLVLLKQQLSQVQSGASTTATAASAPSTTPSFGGSTASADARITALAARIDSAMSALAALAGTAPRANTVSSTLEDDFEDRYALRTRIREAINANSLDDSHDIDGNALYHLQFNATLLPGKANARQFGVARLSLEASSIDQRDIDTTYYTWLSSITNRLNQHIEPGQTDAKTALSYLTVGPVNGLYDIWTLQLKGDQKGSQPTLQLAVPPGHGGDFDSQPVWRNAIRQVWQSIHDSGDEHKGASQLRGMIATCVRDQQCVLQANAHATARPRFAKAAMMDWSGYANDPTLARELLLDLQNYLRFIASVESAVFALGDRSLVDESVKRLALVDMKEVLSDVSDARHLIDALHKACVDSLKQSVKDAKPDSCSAYDKGAIAHAPDDFGKELRRMSGESSDDQPRDHAPWLAYPYGVDPMQRSQRISTVASAANAVELAAALSAQLPQAATSLGAGMQLSRRASGRVDAIQRVPLVIGFSGSGQSGEAGTEGAPTAYEFGWIFGPQVDIDTEGDDLKLVQRPRTVPVSVDMSVPAWWSRAQLRVRTSWTGRFDGAGPVLGAKDAASDEYTLPVRFRPNPAAYDALTVYLSRRLSSQGYHQARIEDVRPKVLPVCTDAPNKSVTMLIYGVDLWRNPRVYLGGQLLAQDQVAVLPDMSGIWATVDTSTLSKSALGSDPALVVWTAHGAAEYPLGIQFSGVCESNAVAQDHPPGLKSFVTRISPARISSCDTKVVFALTGQALPSTPSSYLLNGVEASAGSVAVQQSQKAAQVTFDKLGSWGKGLDTLTLAMITPEGVSTTDIAIEKASCSGDAKPATPPAPFAFTKTIDTLQVDKPEELHTLRMGVGFPASTKAPTITIKATNGEIFSAQPVDALPTGVTLQVSADVVKLAKATNTDKDPGTPVLIDVTLRNLTPGKSLTLSASAKPAPKGTVPPLTIAIEGARPTVATAKP